MEGFQIRNYAGNGVVNHRASRVTYRDLVVENPGLYAIYPVECTNVLVEGCVVSGAKDAGIYVGQSRDIIVRNNEVFHNVAGIEIENSERKAPTIAESSSPSSGLEVKLIDRSLADDKLGGAKMLRTYRAARLGMVDPAAASKLTSTRFVPVAFHAAAPVFFSTTGTS